MHGLVSHVLYLELQIFWSGLEAFKDYDAVSNFTFQNIKQVMVLETATYFPAEELHHKDYTKFAFTLVSSNNLMWCPVVFCITTRLFCVTTQSFEGDRYLASFSVRNNSS